MFCGISQERIQDWVNHNRGHYERNPSFSNKDTLKPIIASRPFERLQIDLVDFSNFKSCRNGKTYSFVLAVLDVFSRYLFLSPLVKKETSAVALEIKDIFHIFGYPEEIQTDKGSEFKGAYHRLFFR